MIVISRKGIKVPKAANLVKQSLEKLPYLEMRQDVWEKAREISASFRRKGITIPLSDLSIAALALYEDLGVFTIDPHFKKVHGLRLYNPP